MTLKRINIAAELKRVFGYWCAILIFCFITNVVTAQNFKYNTNQFGVEGSLLGGAVVAGTDDMSMIYYNPATIQDISSTAEISMIRPRVSLFGFEEFGSNQITNQINTDFDLEPLQVSFKFNIKNRDYGVIIINRANVHDRFLNREAFVDQDVQTTNIFQYEYEGNTRWVGLGTSYKLNEQLSFGISQFVNISGYDYMNEVFNETNDLHGGRFFKSDIERSFTNVGFNTKIGLVYEMKLSAVGFTLTTPMYLPLYRSGSFHNVMINSDLNGATVDELTDLELTPRLRTPWELNLGYRLQIGKNGNVWFNAALFTGVNDYLMAEVNSLDERNEWVNGSHAVFNLAVGYSDHITEHIELLGGVRTNRFGYENRLSEIGEERNTILDGDAINLSLGAKLELKKHSIIIGVDYGRLLTQLGNDGQLIENIDEIQTTISGLTKTSMSVLFTYGFIIDSFRSLRSVSEE